MQKRIWPAVCLGGALLMLTACAPFATRQASQNSQNFDLGSSAPMPLTARPWRFQVEAGGELEMSAMRYRLAYADPAQVMAYAQSRWVAPPADILRRRLEDLLYWQTATIPDQCVLQLELRRFEQVFVSPQESRGVLTARAVLRRGGKNVDERLLTLEAAAPTPDAQGGVAALAAAADALAQSLLDWRTTRSGAQSGGCRD
ncbi:MAG: ABC-type transport auxiliary lipoprotein family protein [Zoogloeaceae bacterium]|jgi:cholesterol transport system auxiliary component|nr:ABC-type transport auxiliary lipoprotein family protein [Zoogloeaceae bacterium]